MLSNKFPHSVVSLHVFAYLGQLGSIADVALHGFMNSTYVPRIVRVSVYVLACFCSSTKFDERP
jgi:hypothetical protein